MRHFNIWIVAVIAVVAPCAAAAPAAEARARELRTEVTWVAPADLSAIVLHGDIVDSQSFLSPGGRLGPIATLSNGATVITDIANSEVYLAGDGRSDSPRRIVRYGQGPAEVVGIVDVMRTEGGFALLDSRNASLGRMYRGSAVHFFNFDGEYVSTTDLESADLPFRLQSLSVAEEFWYALDTFGVRSSTRDGSVRTVDPTASALIRFRSNLGDLETLPVEPWRQKYDLSSSRFAPDVQDLLIRNTRILSTSSYLLVWNTFYRYFDVFGIAGSRFVRMRIDESDPKLPEIGSAASDGRLYRINEDAATTESGLVFFAGISVSRPSLAGIDVFTVDGEYLVSLDVGLYPSFIDVSDGALVVADSSSGLIGTFALPDLAAAPTQTQR